MLREVRKVRQVKGESRRRWFDDGYFDLIVWFGAEDEIVGFQLCYDKYGEQKAITWQQEFGYMHHRVDQGEDKPGKPKATPILVADGIFDYKNIASRFERESGEIDSKISDFVYEKMMQYPLHAGQV
jgi:hypothetical protein